MLAEADVSGNRKKTSAGLSEQEKIEFRVTEPMYSTQPTKLVSPGLWQNATKHRQLQVTGCC